MPRGVDAALPHYTDSVATIFVVEDNDGIREAVTGYLELADHTVREFAGSEGVLDAVVQEHPDLLILDIMLPGESGFALAKQLRSQFGTPFLFLSAREAESDRIFGFELGADDYVVKPFSPRELVLRVEAILRRSGGGARHAVAGEDRLRLTLSESTLTIARTAHAALMDDRELELTASEWRILLYLAGRPGSVVSREQLLTECLDYLHDGSERTVDTHVKNLRAKLGSPEWIETVRGFGYRFAGGPR